MSAHFWILNDAEAGEAYEGRMAIGGPQGVLMVSAKDAYMAHHLRHERDGLRQVVNLTRRALDGLTVPIDKPDTVWALAAKLRQMLDIASKGDS